MEVNVKIFFINIKSKGSGFYVIMFICILFKNVLCVNSSMYLVFRKYWCSGNGIGSDLYGFGMVFVSCVIFR